ncbi:MAG: DUF3857 domain-containing transglutaminase family protein [Granulosicoccus sp.]
MCETKQTWLSILPLAREQSPIDATEQKQMIQPLMWLLVSAICVLAPMQAAAQSAIRFADETAESTDYAITETPAWVKPTTPFDPDLEATGEDSQGYHNRLLDYQFNGIKSGQSSVWMAVEYKLNNRYGVENYSSIELDFDPTYEFLNLHEVSVLRKGKVIDKLPNSQREILQRESELDALIYDGTHTLAIVLNDVRVGDIVRYSYSLVGENPIFQGLREMSVNTERWSSVDRQYSRLLTTEDRPFVRRIRGEGAPVSRQVVDGIEETIVDQRGMPELDWEVDIPSRHYDRGLMVFSDIGSWRDVVDWELPMYTLELPADPQIIEVAVSIRQEHMEDAARIGAALHWVQDEVRYFGVELGANSHRPSLPSETLARRFGDCKDKTQLLIALLHELGFTAEPALVNSDASLESDAYPYRLHAFDHVIVHLEMDGQSHWLDPTITYQRGALGETSEPDYGRALILAEKTESLTEMNADASALIVKIDKTLVVPATPEAVATFEVSTRKEGPLADSIRQKIDSMGLRSLGKDYVEYYQDWFDSIEMTARPSYTDTEKNQLTLVEQYEVRDFWMSDENVDRYRWLNADEIMGYLDKPDEAHSRQYAYAVIHPLLIEENWHVSLPSALRIDDLEAELITPWFEFSKNYELNASGTELSVSMTWKTLVDEIPKADLLAYSEAVDEVEDLASLYIEDIPSEVAYDDVTGLFDGSGLDMDESVNLYGGLAGSAAFIVAMGVRRQRRRNAQNELQLEREDLS